MIYIFGLVLIFINSLLGGKCNKCIVVFLILLFGLRYKTGLDFENYDYFFDRLPINFWDFEIGFYFFALLFWQIGLYYYLGFALIYFGFLVNSFKNNENGVFGLFFLPWLFYGGWDHFSVLRQSLAAVILFFTYRNWEELGVRKWALFLLSLSFHYSAILFIAILVILKNTAPRRYVQFGFLSIAVYLSFNNINVEVFVPARWKYLIQLVGDSEWTIWSLKYIEWLVFTFVFIVIKGRVSHLPTILSLQVLLFAFFGSISYFSERIIIYFHLFYALSLTELSVVLMRKIDIRWARVLSVIVLTVFVSTRYYRYIFKADYSNVPSWEYTNLERFLPYDNVIIQNNFRK